MVTGDDGLYTLAAIPPGTYEIKAELAGFQTATISKTVVTVGSNLSVNVTLPVAGVAENVTVTSRAAAVETNSSRQTNTLNSKAIENLPINGRRFQDFVTLTPTAQVDNSRGQISLAGQRGINSNISIDGADYNQPFFGGIRGGERSNFAFTIPQEAIGEFQVVSSGFSAEFGRSSGGLVNAVTKAGTNTLHGSAFYLNRPKDLAAKNAFDQDAAFDQAQFGGSLGGPIAANKLFFFGAYEQQTFNAPRVVLFDQLVGQSPSANTAEAFNFYKSLEEPFENTNDAWAWLGRVDAQLSDAHRVNVRYNGSRNTADNGAGVGGRIFPTTNSALSNDGTEKNDTNTVVGQLTSVLSPRMLLEVRGPVLEREPPAYRQLRDADVQQHRRNVRGAQLPAHDTERLAHADRGERDLDAGQPQRQGRLRVQPHVRGTGVRLQPVRRVQHLRHARRRARDHDARRHDREPASTARPSPTTARSATASCRWRRTKSRSSCRMRGASSRTSRSTAVCAGKASTTRRQT